eukprot:2787721-Alexandrium_andersonii.AAC.1
MRWEAMDLHAARGDSGAEGKGCKAPAGHRRPVLHQQPSTTMSLRKEPGRMTSSQQEPLEGRRLPWAA